KGAIIVGIVSVFICTATIIAYTSAASRVAFSLSNNGDAPRLLGVQSEKFKTPIGGLFFLGFSFIIVMVLCYFNFVSLKNLIVVPNATFIITYLAGCASGVVLLKDNKCQWIISGISLIATTIIFIFSGWAILYPLAITILVVINQLIKKYQEQPYV
ncbi:MAG: amino acid permease, partial [Clostridium sp.]